MVLYPNQTYDVAVLTWLGATGLLAAEVGLFQNNIIPDANTPRASLTDATYTGYAQVPVTWHLPSIADDGTPEIVSDQIIFRPTGTAIGNTIYGAWVETGAGAYYAPGALDTPVPMTSALDELVLCIRWRLGENPIVEVVS